MKNIFSLIFSLLLTATSFGQLGYTPPPMSFYYSSSGTPAGPWNAVTGSGGTQSLPNTPPPAGMYYSATGTPAGPWYPCGSSCFGGGGGSGTVTSFAFTNGGGFLGTVLNSTTTPTLALTVDGTHCLPTNTGSSTTFLNGACAYTTPAGAPPGGSTNQIQFNAGGGAFGGFTQSGDCTTVVTTGVTTCLSTNGTLFTTFAPLASPALTGSPTAPTQTAGTNNTTLATTGYADRAVSTALSAFPTLPAVANILYDYAMPASDSANAYFTDYSASDGSAIGVGNCTFLASPNAPTYIAGTGGASFGISGVSGGHYTACNIPSGGNAKRTVIAVLQAPLFSGTFTTIPAFNMFLASNGASNGPYIGLQPGSVANKTYGFGSLYGGSFKSASYTVTGGRPCYGMTLGKTTDANVDAFFLNGLPISASSYITGPGHTADVTLSGNDQLGGISTSGIYFLGSIYRIVAWNTYLTPGQVYQACQFLSQSVTNRSVLPAVIQNASSANQKICIGDSIQYGTNGTAPCTLTTTTATYTNSNFSIPGAVVTDVNSQLSVGAIPQCSTAAQQNILINETGTNNLATGTTAASTWAQNVAMLNTIRAGWIAGGCNGKIGIQTIISRAQIDNGTTGCSVTGNGLRDTYNALVRQGWQAAGFDFINDEAEDLNMGINGGNANGTYFSTVDCIHPNNTGYQLMANIISRNLNKAYASSNNSSPVTVTNALSPYTQLDADLLLTPDATSGNVVINATTCIGTGFPLTYRRLDVTANTVTINAFGSELISGSSSITLAAGASVTLVPFALPSTTAGCYWRATTALVNLASGTTGNLAASRVTGAVGSLTGTTGSIGGSALLAGTCASGTATVAGAVVGHTVDVSASDGSLPNALATLSASVTATNTVSVQVCAIAALTPPSLTYNVATY